MHLEYKMRQIIAVCFRFGAIIPIPFLPNKHYGYESAPSDLKAYIQERRSRSNINLNKKGIKNGNICKF